MTEQDKLIYCRICKVYTPHLYNGQTRICEMCGKITTAEQDFCPSCGKPTILDFCSQYCEDIYYSKEV